MISNVCVNRKFPGLIKHTGSVRGMMAMGRAAQSDVEAYGKDLFLTLKYMPGTKGPINTGLF